MYRSNYSEMPNSTYKQGNTNNMNGGYYDERGFFIPFVVGGLAGGALGYNIANNNFLSNGSNMGPNPGYYPMPYPRPCCQGQAFYPFY